MDFSQAIFKYTSESIIVVNDKGEIEALNPASERIFGFEEHELLGKKIEMLIPHSYRKNHEKHREEYVKSPHSRPMGKNLKIRGIHKNGKEIPLQVSLSYFHSNNRLYIICFIIDDTERFEYEERIKKINAELEDKVMMRTRILQEAMHALENSREELQRSLEHEKELNAMKTRFVSMASHEFRTPLSTILSSASLIEKYADNNEKILNHTRKIKNSVSNLTFILNDFLSVGKLEDGKITATAKEIELEPFIRELVSDMQGVLKLNQKILIEGAEENIRLISDPNMLRNILINLISNAIKFSDEGKIIKIIYEKSGSNTIISVSDEGIGIPEEEQKHLFTRFYRAENVTNIQGTGLGLYIVKKMVELLKGNITFVSKINQGTTFTITIPDYDQNFNH
jgi:PAS domain S-box-containing protein